MEQFGDGFKQETKTITIRTIDGSTLIGKVNLGIKERVSDLFTKTENPFIVLFDAEHRDATGKVFFVNKSSIVWVEPNE